MAVTSTQTSNGGVANIKVGRYISSSTAAAFKITTGFKPRYVKVVNLNASGYVQEEWFEGMSDDTAFKSGIDGAQSVISSLGITVAEDGFTVGLDTDINVVSEQLSWIAIG